MKKYISSVFILVFVLISCISNTVYAADYTEGDDLWFSPYNGGAGNWVQSGKMHEVEIWSVRWDSDSISEFDGWDALEIEFRSGTPNVTWRDLVSYGYESTYSELPSAYFENDSDDSSFGCYRPNDLVANQNYEGYMEFTPASSQPSSFELIVECEWGKDYGYLQDPIPEDWDYLLIDLDKGSGTYW